MCRASRPIFIESESRKVGELRVPDQLLLAMRASDCIRLELPLEARVRLLRDEYKQAYDVAQQETLA